MTKPTDCQVEGTFVPTMCKGMKAVFEIGPTRRSKGLFRQTLAGPDDKGNYGHTRNLFIVKSGDSKERGMVLNFCPFCGTDFTPLQEGMYDKS